MPRGKLQAKPDPHAANALSTTRIDSRVDQLVAAQQTGQLASAAQTQGASVSGSLLLVTITARPGSGDAVASAVAGLGGHVTARFDDHLDAYVPVGSVTQLSGQDSVLWVDLPSRPQESSVTSEGWGLVNASGWNLATVSGAGVKVGIIDGGFQGYTSLLGTELPPAASVDTSCTVHTLQNGQQHGTAVAEIIHDVAPGAAMSFAVAQTSVEVGTAEQCMATRGVTVINMSLGFAYDGPGTGSGTVESVVDDAVSRGIFWSNSAGNSAQSHWSGNWTDADGDGVLNFAPDDEGESMYLRQGDTVEASLRWNDPWGPYGSGASCNDYDLYLVDSQNNVVALSYNGQTCWQPPLEHITYVAPVAGYYWFAIVRYNANGAARFDLLVTTQQVLQYQVAAGSLMAPNESANPGMASVGAVSWSNPTSLESFSAQGPTPDGRLKPELVAPDGVSSISLGTLGFSGTSASSPYVAGAAALVKQYYAGYSPAQVRNYLTAHAVDLGVGGSDNMYGSGRLDLAVPPVACVGRPQVSLSVNPNGIGGLQVYVTPTGSGILLRSVQFGNPSTNPGQPVNALIDVSGQSGRSGGFTLDLPLRPPQLGFTVRRPNPGAPTTVPLVVTDGCGAWPTLVGGGAGAF
jgi:subtilisin family serine protease